MAHIESNIDDVIELVRRMYACIDFTRKGPQKLLGEALCDRVSEGCQDRSLNRQRGAKRKWKDNAPGYVKRPEKAGKPVGVLTGEMLSDTEMQGERDIQPRRVTIVYGTNQEVRDKASWFHRGSKGSGPGPPSGAKKQPARPDMWALDDKIRRALNQEVADYLDFLTPDDL